MEQNGTGFRWDARREKAATLLAEDELSDEQIAVECGIGRTTLHRWKQHPAFTARVADHVRALEAETLKYAIAKRRRRIKALDDRWQRMQRLIEARAEELAAHTAGGDTGLLVHQERAIGTGSNQQIIDEYVVDTGLLRELREHEKQAAQELGQWVDKTQGDGTLTVQVVYADVDADAPAAPPVPANDHP